MKNNLYHILAVAGWILNISSSFLFENIRTASFLQGLSSGIILISYLTIIINNRQQKHEATSR